MIGALTLALGACGDDAPASIAIQIHAPPPLDSTGHCPKGAPLSPLQRGQDGPTTLRLTYRRSGGPLVCDVVLPLEGASRIVGVPHGETALPALDLIVEAFRGDAASGAILVGSGEARGIDLQRDVDVKVLVAPRDRFACAGGPLGGGRAFHSATTLPNGEVLVVGGIVPDPRDPSRTQIDLSVPDPGASTGTVGGFYAASSVEIYDPRRGTFRDLVVPELVPRAFHQAYLLATADGSSYAVVLVGGVTVQGDPATTPVVDGIRDTAEPLRITPSGNAVPAPTEVLTYDPVSQTATRARLDPPAGSDGRMFAAATRPRSPGDDPTFLPQTPPLLAGGWSEYPGVALTTFEALDAVTGTKIGDGTWLTGGLLRAGATLTRLAGDRALLWGGNLGSAGGSEPAETGSLLSGLAGTPSSALVTFDALMTQPSPRAFHTATPLDGERVLVVGGFAVAGGTTGDPAAPFAQVITVAQGGVAGVATDVGVGGGVPVGYHDATPLLGGDVLLSGGNPATGLAASPCPDGTINTHLCSVGDAWRWRAAASTLEHLATTPLLVPRWGHRSAVLLDGTVLITGGLRYREAEGLVVVVDAELYNPRTEARDAAADSLGDGLPPRTPGDIARTAEGDAFSECPVVVVP